MINYIPTARNDFPSIYIQKGYKNSFPLPFLLHSTLKLAFLALFWFISISYLFFCIDIPTDFLQLRNIKYKYNISVSHTATKSLF